MAWPTKTISYHNECEICGEIIKLGGSGWLRINQDLKKDLIGEKCSFHRKNPESDDYSQCKHLTCTGAREA